MIERLKDPDFREAIPPFLIGSAQGVFKYYIQPELTPKRAWLTVGAIIIGHDIACKSGNTMSEGVDRALEANKVLTMAAIGVTAAHLANLLPPRLDPLH